MFRWLTVLLVLLVLGVVVPKSEASGRRVVLLQSDAGGCASDALAFREFRPGFVPVRSFGSRNLRFFNSHRDFNRPSVQFNLGIGRLRNRLILP